jgi:hypothetical protein
VSAPNRTHLICAVCGSMDVSADAYAQWDVDAGEWALQSTYDAKTCETCESRTTLLSIDEATGLEIQIFAMVHDGDDARPAQIVEKVDFYDVMLSTTSLEGGIIFSLEERENLTAKEAAVALADLQTIYPTTPIEPMIFACGPVQ